MSILKEFRDEIEAHLKESGVQPTSFGMEALNDPKFVFDLREGRQPRFDTMDKVREYMSAHSKSRPAE